ncbi:uncharacterized protein LOC110769999 isoform X2 [Prunus avium]|uniref:Uncharacterized protein LOC110769999 isoform X2 n=1 Tax=Prunus avium TaxID=42229 RepID=A0A6P5TRK0_PRUAV|nr:uncharacterized protein LOC110769999 isoform X2 [Prunus avium]
MADGSRSRSETEQLNQSPQERVRNRFPGRSRTLSGQELQEERTEQELQQNENREAENTDESNETNNMNENYFSAIDSTDVGIHHAYNEEGGGGDQAMMGRNHNISHNRFYAKNSRQVGISNVGNKNYNKSSVPFLLGLLILLVLALFLFFFSFYILTVSKQNKK